MELGAVLEAAEQGTLKACRHCPWNPQTARGLAFGTSCTEHGAVTADRVVSMQIVQDPGDTTPALTGRLCFVCNSTNPSDRTAQHAYDLWKAAVARDGSDRFVSGHYWTNATMHGAPRANGVLRGKEDDARSHCVEVLEAQIRAVQPRVIVASGQAAVESLNSIGLLRKKWGSFSHRLGVGPHRELRRLDSGATVHVFASYHTSARVVNCTIATHRYSASTEEALAESVETTARPTSNAFLKNYTSDTPEGRGMRVLLAHWLPIGEAIRHAHS